MVRLLKVAIPALLVGACAAPQPAPIETAQAPAGPDQCFDEVPQNWAVLTLEPGGEMGGISGVDYDPASKQFVMISDDRGPHGGTHLFDGTLDLKADRNISLTITSEPILQTEAGHGVDAESVRLAPGGGLFWTSEGDAKQGIAPALYRQEPGAKVSEKIPLPAMLQADPEGRRGPRDNGSFEGLSLSKDGALWIGVEVPLIEQGPVPTASSGSLTTIMQLTPGKAGYRAFAYPLEPIPQQLPGKFADNGLSEILALGRDRLLVIERSGSQQADDSFHFITRLFCAMPGAAKTEDGRQVMTKQLVAELDSLGPFDRTNFEGITFGPVLPDGRPSLILASDNNFTEEPTVLLVLALDKPE